MYRNGFSLTLSHISKMPLFAMFVRVTISWRLHCLSKTYVGPSTFLTYTEALFFVCLPVPYWTKFMSHLIQVRWMKIAAACDELRTFTKMLWRKCWGRYAYEYFGQWKKLPYLRVFFVKKLKKKKKHKGCLCFFVVTC